MKYDELENSTKIILKVIFAALALAFLWGIRDIILILILSLVLASAMDPLVGFFHRHKIPRGVSVIAVYVIVLGAIGLGFYFITPVVIDQFKFLQSNWPQYAESFRSRFGGLDVSSFLQQVFPIANGQNFINSTFGIFNGFIAVISVLVISFYLVAEQKGMRAFIGTLVPAKHHEFTVSILAKIQQKMGMWIIGQFIICFIMFAITWIGLSILKVPYALVLAVIAGILEVVPYIGPILSAVPAIFIGLLQGIPFAFGVAVLYLLLHELEGYVLVPKIMEKTVGTSPLAVLVGLLIGFKLAGVIGLLIAVPLIGAFTVVINEFWGNKTAET